VTAQAPKKGAHGGTMVSLVPNDLALYVFGLAPGTIMAHRRGRPCRLDHPLGARVILIRGKIGPQEPRRRGSTGEPRVPLCWVIGNGKGEA
jgi:hypothetical protein